MVGRAEASQRVLVAEARFDGRARLVRTTRCHWSYKDSRGTQGRSYRNKAGILQMNPEQRRIFALFPRSGKTGGRRGRLPSPWAEPTGVGRLSRPFSLIFERTPPVCWSSTHDHSAL